MTTTLVLADHFLTVLADRDAAVTGERGVLVEGERIAASPRRSCAAPPTAADRRARAFVCRGSSTRIHHVGITPSRWQCSGPAARAFGSRGMVMRDFRPRPRNAVSRVRDDRVRRHHGAASALARAGRHGRGRRPGRGPIRRRLRRDRNDGSRIVSRWRDQQPHDLRTRTRISWRCSPEPLRAPTHGLCSQARPAARQASARFFHACCGR